MLESRRLEDWDYSFLKSIFDAKLPEWTNLEYKRDFPARDVEKNKLEHTICAFANTRGGYVLIGVEADTAENTPVAINGIDDAEGLYERITNFCARITPRIAPRLYKVRIPETNKIVLVIHVFESNEAHMASDGKYYIRVNAQSLPADHYTVQKLFKKELEFKEKMNEIIESRKRSLQLENAWIRVIILPYGFKENLIPIFDEKSGKLNKGTADFLTSNQPILHSWDYKPTQFSFLQYSKNREGRIYSFVEVSHNGLIEIGTEMGLGEKTPIGLQWIKGYLKEILEFANKAYSFSGHDGSIRFVLNLINIKHRELVLSNFQFDRYVYTEDNLVVQRDVALNNIRNNLDAIIDGVAAELMRSFGVNIFST